MKHCLKIALIIFLILNLGGCAQLRRKFVRKKEPKREQVSFYRVEEYQPKPPQERYREHYMLWRNWHLDLLRREDTSHLKDLRAMNESLRHLTAMKDLLAEEKAEELNAQIEDMQSVLERLKERKRDIMDDVHSRRIAERVERIIINQFSYNRVEEYIK